VEADKGSRTKKVKERRDNMEIECFEGRTFRIVRTFRCCDAGGGRLALMSAESRSLERGAMRAH